MPSVRSRTKRPRGALLQLDIGSGRIMCSIGGRLRSLGASLGGVAGEIPPLVRSYSYRDHKMVMRQNYVFLIAQGSELHSPTLAALFPSQESEPVDEV